MLKLDCRGSQASARKLAKRIVRNVLRETPASSSGIPNLSGRRPTPQGKGLESHSQHKLYLARRSRSHRAHRGSGIDRLDDAAEDALRTTEERRNVRLWQAVLRMIED